MMMSRVYDEYAIYNMTLEDARARVEHLLDIDLDPHDSSHYRFTYFLASGVADEEFQLAINQDFEGEPLTDHENLTTAIILSIGPTERGDELRDILLTQSDIRHLRRDVATY